MRCVFSFYKVCQLVDRLGTRGSDVACVQCCNHNTTELEHPCNAFLCHKGMYVFVVLFKHVNINDRQ